MKPKIDNGFIQIACGKPDNDILTALAGAGLYSTEFEVVLIVIRKTWGWKKNWDWVSLSTFQKLTRKSRPMIVQALSDLVVKQILLVDKKDKNKPLYAFNERFIEWTSKPQLTSKVELTSKPQLTTLVKQSLPILVKQSLPTKKNKETIQKKTEDFVSLLNWWNTRFKTSYRTTPPNKKYMDIFFRWIENGGNIQDIKVAKVLSEHNPRWGKGIGIDSLLRSGKTKDADWVEHFINFEGYEGEAKKFQQEYLSNRNKEI